MIFKTKLAFELNVSQWKHLSKQKHWGCIQIKAPEGSGGFRILKRTYWPASFWPCGKEVFIHLSKMQKTHYRVLECVSWLGWWSISFVSSTSWFSYVFIGDMAPPQQGANREGPPSAAPDHVDCSHCWGLDGSWGFLKDQFEEHVV